jgi:hypothetical protein
VQKTNKVKKRREILNKQKVRGKREERYDSDRLAGQVDDISVTAEWQHEWVAQKRKEGGLQWKKKEKRFEQAYNEKDGEKIQD